MSQRNSQQNEQEFITHSNVSITYIIDLFFFLNRDFVLVTLIYMDNVI